MTIRRAIVWVISALVGLVATVTIINAFDTTLDKFTYANALLVFLGFGSLAFIWLDYILRTQYLKS